MYCLNLSFLSHSFPELCVDNKHLKYFLKIILLFGRVEPRKSACAFMGSAAMKVEIIWIMSPLLSRSHVSLLQTKRTMIIRYRNYVELFKLNAITCTFMY